MLFETRGAPHFVADAVLAHGRIGTRRMGRSAELNRDLDFPDVGQVHRIERESIDKKTGALSLETALGITSRTPQDVRPKRALAVSRGHWSVELHFQFQEDSHFKRGAPSRRDEFDEFPTEFEEVLTRRAVL